MKVVPLKAVIAAVKRYENNSPEQIAAILSLPALPVVMVKCPDCNACVGEFISTPKEQDNGRI